MWSAIILGALGLGFGVILSIASKKLAVPIDPREESIRQLLPGANCGGCGYPGCDAFAASVVKGEVQPDGCPVGGAAIAVQIAAIMGACASAAQQAVALVRCRGGEDRCNLRFEYDGIADCRAAALIAGGDKACQFSCLGLGTCKDVCVFDAIILAGNRLARIDESKCVGCGRCAAECPRGVISMVPRVHPVHSVCSALERGKVVRDACSAGCLGCGKCERMCKFGALKMQNNLPQIDMTLCKGCMRCADGCPTGALIANESLRRRAVITYPKCAGCNACAEACRFEAITGAHGEHHNVIAWNCVGCGECVTVCKDGYIRMISTVKLN